VEDFLKLILQSIEFLWPFATVYQYEQGVFYAFGKVWRCWPHAGVYPPGTYLKVPWFTKMHAVSVIDEPVITGRCDIMARDGRPIMYNATAMFRVVDALKAANLIHSYETGMAALLAGVLSEKLSEVEATRFDPTKRKALNTDLRRWVESEAAEYGLEVKWLRFSTFVLGAKTLRLLTDIAAPAAHEVA
jgi:regulator of protease activity HflC (stomatin/prohibitin superfamily)